MFRCMYLYAKRRASARVCRRGRHRRRAAGVTWSVVTSNAPWAARSMHTTVIDAAGTMYLIGGEGNTGNLDDVWSSANRGANRLNGDLQGVLKGYSSGAQGVLQGYSRGSTGYSWALTKEVRNKYARVLLEGSSRVSQWHLRGTREALKMCAQGEVTGYSGRAQGVLTGHAGGTQG
jgi:hypothetical protein